MKKLSLVVNNKIAAHTAPRGKLSLVPQKRRPALNYGSGSYEVGCRNHCMVGGVVMSRDDAIAWDMR